MDRRFLVVGIVVLFVALAGCSSAGDVTPTSTPVQETTPTPTPASAQTPTATPTATPGHTTDATTPTSEPTAEGELEVHAINVGQADATLIITPENETMLIDSGDWRNSGETVLAYLDTHDIQRLDHLVATHAHADHIGGHDVIIETFETERDGIGAVWDSGVPHTSQTYERYLDSIEAHDVTLYATREGDDIPFETDGLTATVVNPPEDSARPNNLHYNSVSIHIEYGATSTLFTGDTEGDAEARMVDTHGDDLTADLYHAGHHGSSTSSTAGFLDTVAPAKAIVSSSYDSQYGHPHEEVLDAFAERGIDTYWTAVHGSIVFSTDGQEWTVTPQTDATTNPQELRDEPETDAEPADREAFRSVAGSPSAFVGVTG